MTAVTGPTPGHAADDTAALAAFAERCDFDAPDGDMVVWLSLPENEREKWRAIAGAAVRAETRRLRELVEEILGTFDAASLGGVRIARTGARRVSGWRERAGLKAER